MLNRALNRFPGVWLRTIACGLVGDLGDEWGLASFHDNLACRQYGVAASADHMFAPTFGEQQDTSQINDKCSGNGEERCRLRLDPVLQISVMANRGSSGLACDALQDVERSNV